MSMHSKRNGIPKIAELLSIAIRNGDQLQAKQHAATLATKSAELNIELLSQDPSTDEKDNTFSLRVNIEDRESSGSSITMNVRAMDTISSLKKRMLLKHMFPVEVQKWIIGKRIPKDEETLRKCGILCAGNSVYLYLVSAKSVGLSKAKDDFQSKLAKELSTLDVLVTAPIGRQCSNLSSTSGSSLSPSIQDTPYHAPSRQPSQPPVPEECILPMNIQGSPTDQSGSKKKMIESLNLQIPNEAMQWDRKSPVVYCKQEEPNEMGWQCPKCTFINSPTRPGCQMCTTSRPFSYKVPDGYVPPHNEQQRLELEEQFEQETLLVAQQERRGDRVGNVSEKDLDNMIQFHDAVTDVLCRK